MVELVIVDRLRHTQEEEGQDYLTSHTLVVGPLVCPEHRKAAEVDPQAQAVHFDRVVGPQVVHFDREVVLNFEDTSQADFVGQASTLVGPKIEGISFVEEASDCSTEEGIIAKVGFKEEAFILAVVIEVDTITGEDIIIITAAEVGTVAVLSATVEDTVTTAMGDTATTVQVGTAPVTVEVGTGQEDTASIVKVVKLVAFLINNNKSNHFLELMFTTIF